MYGFKETRISGTYYGICDPIISSSQIELLVFISGGKHISNFAKETKTLTQPAGQWNPKKSHEWDPRFQTLKVLSSRLEVPKQ